MPEQLLRPKRTKPKGSGRQPLPKKEKKERRKASIEAYKSSRSELKCLIDPSLYNRLRDLKNELNLSYEQLLVYLLEKAGR
jgi:hypothetical protein